jgi:hypothetical protein
MSSPKANKPKASATKAAPAKAAKVARPAKPAAAKGARTQSVGEFSDTDKAHFVKAMWEGVKPRGAPAAEEPKVEVLRKISAPVTPPHRETPESAEALKLSKLLEAKLASGELEALTPQAMQSLMAVLVKMYSASAEAGDRYPILQDRMSVTGTDAMIVCGALLRAVDLQVFELGMWQSWSGM